MARLATDLHVLRARFLVVAVVAVICAPGAQAQQAPAPLVALSNIEVIANTYLWFPWTSVNIRPSNTAINSRSETIDPGQLYGHLTWVPFMGAAEFRNGPYGLVLDYIHAPLKAGIGTRDILFNGASSGLGMDIGAAAFLYRPIAQPEQQFALVFLLYQKGRGLSPTRPISRWIGGGPRGSLVHWVRPEARVGSKAGRLETAIATISLWLDQRRRAATARASTTTVPNRRRAIRMGSVAVSDRALDNRRSSVASRFLPPYPTRGPFQQHPKTFFTPCRRSTSKSR